MKLLILIFRDLLYFFLFFIIFFFSNVINVHFFVVFFDFYLYYLIYLAAEMYFKKIKPGFLCYKLAILGFLVRYYLYIYYIFYFIYCIFVLLLKIMQNNPTILFMVFPLTENQNNADAFGGILLASIIGGVFLLLKYSIPFLLPEIQLEPISEFTPPEIEHKIQEQNMSEALKKIMKVYKYENYFFQMHNIDQENSKKIFHLNYENYRDYRGLYEKKIKHSYSYKHHRSFFDYDFKRVDYNWKIFDNYIIKKEIMNTSNIKIEEVPLIKEKSEFEEIEKLPEIEQLEELGKLPETEKATSNFKVSSNNKNLNLNNVKIENNIRPKKSTSNFEVSNNNIQKIIEIKKLPEIEQLEELGKLPETEEKHKILTEILENPETFNKKYTDYYYDYFANLKEKYIILSDQKEFDENIKSIDENIKSIDEKINSDLKLENLYQNLTEDEKLFLSEASDLIWKDKFIFFFDGKNPVHIPYYEKFNQIKNFMENSKQFETLLDLQIDAVNSLLKEKTLISHADLKKFDYLQNQKDYVDNNSESNYNKYRKIIEESIKEGNVFKIHKNLLEIHDSVQKDNNIMEIKLINYYLYKMLTYYENVMTEEQQIVFFNYCRLKFNPTTIEKYNELLHFLIKNRFN